MALHFERVGFDPDFVDYRSCLQLQQEVHDQIVAGERGNTVLLLEHNPVYTAGRRTEKHEYPWDGTEVVPIGRGGKLTYHGPGMLVGYPIMRLPIPLDVVKVVRVLEEIIIAVVKDFGVAATTVEGRSGAWVLSDERGPDRKISAIGVQVSKRVTMHGFALNCSNDLRPFGKIIPCGITDAGVTSISQETGNQIDPVDVVERMEQELAARESDLCLPFEPDSPATPLTLDSLVS
ncbi:lipoyl(octanoyl) transferase LipB [Kocuria sp. cx-116]|uniref:lipoyl(octanoyl) transferase LipB n=1 Tax=Kocuria sp. cx-116 TaxID=2771378 RepID=UPI001682F32B|nr:lipoyl(octanoyl) transferase LipB [Kocuria sp. cx-116]MBD2763335.1 lipoyl(octanoyl) transferase LipB [Kocuria sp. cx-116]